MNARAIITTVIDDALGVSLVDPEGSRDEHRDVADDIIAALAEAGIVLCVAVECAAFNGAPVMLWEPLPSSSESAE